MTQIKAAPGARAYLVAMDDRIAQLQRRIAFYRKNLEEGVGSEVARQHLQAIAELEAELAKLTKNKTKS